MSNEDLFEAIKQEAEREYEIYREHREFQDRQSRILIRILTIMLGIWIALIIFKWLIIFKIV